MKGGFHRSLETINLFNEIKLRNGGLFKILLSLKYVKRENNSL